MLRFLPNVITLLRIGSVAPLVFCLLKQNYATALMIAVLAGLTDALDGWLAKRFGWQTWIGGILDPVADKLLLMTSFITLSISQVIPDWLTALVVGRDAAIVMGAVGYRYLIGSLDPEPTWLSKITTLFQILYIVLILASLAKWLNLPSVFFDGFIWIVALSTFSSGIHYVIVWSLKAKRDYHAHREKTS